MSHLLNQVILGDCLEVLANVSPESIDLAYLDPPFNTGRTHHASEGNYADCWRDTEEYLGFIRPRIEAIHRVLKSNGSILLHCDWRTCHHLRLLLDDVFGIEGFVNHVIWQYGLGGSSPRRFTRKHDDILFYAKGPDYFFSPLMIPATSQRMKGQTKKASDVIAIPSINNMAKERVGYPTQKPLQLLELLINACCASNGIVLDAFCGSGTTLVAAQDTNRNFIGIDTNEDAIRISRSRLSPTKKPLTPVSV